MSKTAIYLLVSVEKCVITFIIKQFLYLAALATNLIVNQEQNANNHYYDDDNSTGM